MSIHINKITLLNKEFPTDENYPFTLPLLHQTDEINFNTPVTIFVGENGTGKSTLLEAIAKACGIHIWTSEKGSRYKMNKYEEMLYRYIRVEWTNDRVPGSFFGSDIFRDFTYILDEWASSDPDQLKYFGGESLVTQSHGQSMMSYFRARYNIEGIYFLDEPETALSPRSQLELLDIITRSSKAGYSQFIIATHSPILSACSGATIYSFDHIPLRETDYEETEHYKVYKDFFEDRKKYI